MNLFSTDDHARYRAEGQWGELTLPEMFAATCARVPDRLGLVDAPNRAEIFEGAPRRLTYAQMRAEVDRYAAILQAQGIGPGALVATQLPNISEMILIYLAVSQIGAVLSPVSLAYRSAELHDLSQVAAFDAYISVGRFKGQDYFAERNDALPDSVQRLGIGDGLPAGVTRIDTAAPGKPPAPVALDADDIFAVFWTSGTEGVPKAVPKTHNNMMSSSLGAWRLLNLPDGTNILGPFPFVNAAAMGGLLMCWMRTAGALILHHPFDVAVFLEQLKSEEIGYTMVAPTILTYLRDQARDPDLHPALHRLMSIGTGSAPPDPEVFLFFEETFATPVVNFFGSNEGAQMCSSCERVPNPRHRASYFPRDGDENWDPALRTANGGTFRLVDPTTGDLITEPGGLGEMHLHGPALMPGYYSRQGIDRSKFTEDGYFPSGDLFQISDCGTLIRFHARSRELIVRGGMKIAPVELDNVLSALPGVREVAVAAYADPHMGEKVCLFAVMEPGRGLDLPTVTAFCDDAGLAKFKWPERLELFDALPRTPLAKLDRKALAGWLAQQGAQNA
ncbi:Short-chain-fatty-acid--CoA ligase [Thalassovita gelatinovora]|uniref:Short-chain-fatty-acid--CoA ligase n=1 Tax=Thalassovita gelatinovora TaxID=53501 RepID=A0A0P1F6E4_THAGE|nr:class I adenylate-forming enzyme family protein [Thalassovita gelatinovora]QIZ79586.1 acyl--CoA ligase [Thalassovita gelatinovora]CUH63080.1 Short-chain-fatty-acid--CoA ligase [Thalassovita gelatinovora]SEQ15397.1 Acyl-CoA synthetase (AMP-forming)/AMP-acid ligase II [Thalassovita gelatinovora]